MTNTQTPKITKATATKALAVVQDLLHEIKVELVRGDYGYQIVGTNFENLNILCASKDTGSYEMRNVATAKGLPVWFEWQSEHRLAIHSTKVWGN